MSEPGPAPGSVYILASERFPGVLKIGRTGRFVGWRAAELAREPGYRGFAPWRHVATCEVDDAAAVERAVHRRFWRRRVRLRVGCRELFRVDEARARQAVEQAAAGWRPMPRGRRLPPELVQLAAALGACAAAWALLD